MWLTILAKYWKPLAIVVVSALAFVYVRHLGVTATEAKYKPIVAAANLARDQAQADLAAERVNLQKAQKASKGYKDELQSLRVASSVPAPSVRCLVTRSVVPQAPAASGPNGAAAGTGGSTQATGQTSDIGAGLYGIADSCDAISARLRGLQAWAASISQ